MRKSKSGNWTGEKEKKEWTQVNVVAFSLNVMTQKSPVMAAGSPLPQGIEKGVSLVVGRIIEPSLEIEPLYNYSLAVNEGKYKKINLLPQTDILFLNKIGDYKRKGFIVKNVTFNLVTDEWDINRIGKSHLIEFFASDYFYLSELAKNTRDFSHGMNWQDNSLI